MFENELAAALDTFFKIILKLNIEHIMKNHKIYFSIAGILLILLVFIWPGFFSKLAIWIAPTESNSMGMTKDQYEVYYYISNCLGTIFIGFAFIASFFAFLQMQEQLKASRSQHQLDRLLKSLEIVSPDCMRSDVINFIDALCEWHVVNEMWKERPNVTVKQKNEYVKLIKEWRIISKKHMVNCAHCVTILIYKEQMELEETDINLIEAEVAQKIGEQEKNAIIALYFKALNKGNEMLNLFEQIGMHDAKKSLSQYISIQIKNKNRRLNANKEKIVRNNILSFLRNKYIID